MHVSDAIRYLIDWIGTIVELDHVFQAMIRNKLLQCVAEVSLADDQNLNALSLPDLREGDDHIPKTGSLHNRAMKDQSQLLSRPIRLTADE